MKVKNDRLQFISINNPILEGKILKALHVVEGSDPSDDYIIFLLGDIQIRGMISDLITYHTEDQQPFFTITDSEAICPDEFIIVNMSKRIFKLK